MFKSLRNSDWQTMLLWAMLAGVLGACATALFRFALDEIDLRIFGSAGSLVAIAQALPWWLRLGSPIIGGLLAGLLLQRALGGRAHPKTRLDYMDAVAMGEGKLAVRPTMLRSTSSLISIASGGSIGREGSMVQLAALSTSVLGRWLHFPVKRLRLLVACGAAAGITAAYSAPIAGAFFVAEIVLGSITMESLGPILVASVVSNMVMRNLPGYQPPYSMPPFPEVTGIEVLLYAPLGLLVGLTAIVFLRGIDSSRKLFEKTNIPLPLRLALGGFVVGAISLQFPEVWGNGYNVVTSILHHPWAWDVLALLIVAKAFATFATVGSGAVGGVFTPALFFGCVVGELFGQAAQSLWPSLGVAPFTFAIVGMGAFLAGASQAPLMAVLMIFEMTLSYQVMLPLILGSVIAYFIVRSSEVGSMYHINLQRQRHQLEQERLRTIHMRDLVHPPETVVQPEATVEAMSQLFFQYPVKYLYVVDESNNYLGVVPLKALQGTQGNLEGQTAQQFLSQEITPVTAEMTLEQGLKRFIEHKGERLPIVESAANPQLLGVVNKTELLNTYVRLSENL